MIYGNECEIFLNKYTCDQLTGFVTLIRKDRISLDASLFFSGPQNVSGKFGISLTGLVLRKNERF